MIVDRFAPTRFGPGFRWLMASSWSTNLGDGIAASAGPLLVASLTSNPLAVSGAALLAWAPPLILSLWAGVLSDRVDRRRIMLTGNVVRLAVLAALVTLLATGLATVTSVLISLALLAVAEVFVDNTQATLLPMLVAPGDLLTANARLRFGSITLNNMAGPALGALLFAAGRVWPVVTQAVLVLAGVLLISRLHLPPLSRRPPSRTWSDVAEGLRWTWAHPAVRTLALTILIFNLTYGAAWSILVLYATERLHVGPAGFGLLSTAGALGGLAGTAAYGRITARVSLGTIMRAGLLIETFTHLALALTTSLWPALVILFVMGAHAFIWGTTSTAIRQRAVPLSFQGRVNAVYVMGLYGGLVIGSALGGVLATHFGVLAPFWFAFAGSALFVALLWRQMPLIAHTSPPSEPMPAS
ncbi:MFS transporter [Catenuloplanes japonicus]|uniref:MFS transporter n=1 Tax=Catenuloplanes japonicus TaxID=33876 RepID=UPI00052557D9|nr:MFS transporter [Catenuloplanes japonicus]